MAIDVEQQVEIERPPQQVFDYLAHAENMPRWMKEFETVEQLTAGEPGKGTVYRYKMSSRGRAESTFEWSDFEPARRIAWQGAKVRTGPGSMQPSGEWLISERDGRTHLTMRMQPKTGGLMSVLAPLMARSIRKGAPDDMRRLKEQIESSG